MGKKLCFAIVGVLISLIGYLFTPMKGFDPNPVPLARYLEYHPILFNDTALDNVHLIKSNALKFPEDLDVDESAGIIYTGLVDGSIVRIKDEKIEVIAKGKDTILGVKLSKDLRHLYFADTGAGICRLDLLNT